VACTSVNPEWFGKLKNVVTKASNFGNVSDVYNGVDFRGERSTGERIALLQGGFQHRPRMCSTTANVVGKVDNAGGGGGRHSALRHERSPLQ